MSIENTWGSIKDAADEDLDSLLQTSGLPKGPSHHPLKKIKSNLLINIIWGILICGGYVAIISYFHIWQVQAAIGITLVFSLWAVYNAVEQYKQINTSVSTGNNLLNEMRRQRQAIDNWLKVQQKVALIIYPVSAAGGFMLGGVIGSGKPVEVFMSKPIVIIALIVSIAVLVPACYYLARWMCKFSFGRHLAALEQNIRELELEK